MTWATTHTLSHTHMSSLCSLECSHSPTQVISLIPASTLTHDLSSHTHTHTHSHVIPVFTRVLTLTQVILSSSLCSFTHDLSSHTLTHTTVLTHSVTTHPCHPCVLTLTSLLRELVLPLTLTFTCHPCQHSHGAVLPPSVFCVFSPMCSHSHSHSHPHTHPPILVLPHTSFHLILTHNPSPHTPTTLPHDFTPSCLHHIIIASSPLHHLNHHQSLPLIPHNTIHLFLLLPTLSITS